MRSSGIVRKIDELGRVVIPSDVLKAHGLKDKGDILVEMYMINNDSIGVKLDVKPADKQIGSVRKMDNLGRVVIPMDMRRRLGLGHEVPLEVYTDDDMIVLRAYSPGCIICGEIKDTIVFQGRHFCFDCVGGMSALVDYRKKR